MNSNLAQLLPNYYLYVTSGYEFDLFLIKLGISSTTCSLPQAFYPSYIRRNEKTFSGGESEKGNTTIYPNLTDFDEIGKNSTHKGTFLVRFGSLMDLW